MERMTRISQFRPQVTWGLVLEGSAASPGGAAERVLLVPVECLARKVVLLKERLVVAMAAVELPEEGEKPVATMKTTMDMELAASWEKTVMIRTRTFRGSVLTAQREMFRAVHVLRSDKFNCALAETLLLKEWEAAPLESEAVSVGFGQAV